MCIRRVQWTRLRGVQGRRPFIAWFVAFVNQVNSNSVPGNLHVLEWHGIKQSESVKVPLMHHSTGSKMIWYLFLKEIIVTNILGFYEHVHCNSARKHHLIIYTIVYIYTAFITHSAMTMWYFSCACPKSTDDFTHIDFKINSEDMLIFFFLVVDCFACQTYHGKPAFKATNIPLHSNFPLWLKPLQKTCFSWF